MLKLPSLRSRNINDTIDDNVRHMDTFRPELARQGLRQRAQSEFPRREGREISRPFHAGGRAREDQCRGVLQAFGLEEERQYPLGEVEPAFPVSMSVDAGLDTMVFPLKSWRGGVWEICNPPLAFESLGELGLG